MSIAKDDQTTPLDTLMHTQTSRRKLLRWGSVTVAAAGTLSACGKVPAGPLAPTQASASQADTNQNQMDHNQTQSTATPAKKEKDWQEMDRMHEEGIKAFPAETKGKGMQPLPFTVEDGVKVFELTCEKVMWEVEQGKELEAWTYNGQVPGPEIRVTEGDRVRFNVTNNLDESTAIHWHGLIIPNDQDGVPFMTQPPITPGSSYTYEFTVKNPGSHMYHSHANSAQQVSMGMLGPFIIEPKDPSQDPAFDKEYTLILNDSAHGFTINGKGFPATQPLIAKQGEKIRIRYMNEGLMIHPMHLHGMPQLVFAKDGWNLPQPFLCDTVNIAPGERWDVIVDCTELGLWAFHCHILTHAEGPHGMFGMVTALIVEK